MALTLGNPIICPVGTNTANFSRAIKVTNFAISAQSATSVAVQISDPSGSVQFAGTCPATVGLYNNVADAPVILPGGTNNALNNWTVTVTGAGGSLLLYHR